VLFRSDAAQKRAEKQAKTDAYEIKDREHQEMVAEDAATAATIKEKYLAIKEKYRKIIGTRATLPDSYIETNIEAIKSDIQKLQDLDSTCNKIDPNKIDKKFIQSVSLKEKSKSSLPITTSRSMFNPVAAFA
jgi:hypothetical protein